MIVKSIVSGIALISFLFTATTHTKINHSFPAVSNLQDTIPSPASIPDADIDTVTGSYKKKVINVKMKSGDFYSYDFSTWDYEYKTKLTGKIRTVAETFSRIYTKAEYMPSFPGGDEAWNKYIKKFCEENKTSLKDLGRADIYVQFTVDNTGELSDIRAMQETDSKLAHLAEDAVQQSQVWIPAVIKGRKIVCIQKVIVKF